MVIDEGKEVNKELTLKIQLSICVCIFKCLWNHYWIAQTKFFMVTILNELVIKSLDVLIF